MASASYDSPEGKALRNDESIEEDASFLVKWASELFGEWGTWLQ